MNFQNQHELSIHHQERFSLAEPFIGAFDIDKTTLYQSPQELAAAVHLLNIFGRKEFNFFGTVITQHLCVPKEYEGIAHLNWNIKGERILPPVMLDMGTVAAWPNKAGSKLENHTIINAEGFNFVEYAKKVRPKVMALILDEFPEMIDFEAGMVMIGAQLNQKAINKYGNGNNQALAKEKMMPILESRLKKEGIGKFVWTMKEGKDLDCAPIPFKDRGKMIGINTLITILKNDKRYQGIAESVDLSRIVLADDKAYAAQAPALRIMRSGGGVVLSAQAQERLIKAVQKEGLRDSFVIAKHPRAMEVVMAAFKLALQKDALTQK